MSASAEKSIIQLTDAAVAHIQQMIERRGGNKYFRLSIKPSGCSGYMYRSEIVDDKQSGDLHMVTSQGLSVFIDFACVGIVKGTTLDFVATGLGQQQLLFRNPNVANECGCGESFNLKEVIDE